MANVTGELETRAEYFLNRRESNVRRRRGWYMAQGILFILAGMLAFIVPFATVWAVQIVLAALLLVSGGYRTYHGAIERSGWMIFLGLLSLGVGVFLLVVPVVGVIAVATTIAVFLFAEGILEIILSRQMRFSRHWGWLLVSGILSIALAVILLVGWPGQTVILTGLFLGINFILYGVSLLALVISISRSEKA